MSSTQTQTRVLSDKQIATLLALMVALMPFSIDAYLPAIPAMAESLSADIHHIEQSLSGFLFGVAMGQIVGGSLSDIKGRRIVGLIGLFIYIVSAAGLIFIQTADQLLLLRVIQAFGAGMTVVTVGATVRDNYTGRKAAQMFALIAIIMMAAPLISPLLGAGLQSLGGWRAIFVFLTIYSSVVWCLLYWFLHCHESVHEVKGSIISVVLGRYRRVFATKPALGYLFFQAFSFASMFSFLTESSFVYMKLYGISSHQYAWVFGMNIITMATFNRITAWRLKRGTHAQDILKWGIIVQFSANLLMVALVLMLGMPPMWMLVGCVMVSVGTQGLITANTQACFMSYFKEEGGSANAALGVFQTIIGALAGMLTAWLHNGTPMVMSGMMLASTCVGIILLWHHSHSTWYEIPDMD
ncbi:multidrug effflux MFS transporter [Neisseria montereyensis]|uniref:Bcr/CflA family efflux transporter n=1 Tax=Neisseria montereyensis TaxID=2973938 RepID=A0ABT2FE82_9NEIS|nr:multidrug effflux MFS transporter [Neisseria montereyensis]MCS4534226.1 multidrug effflux MFS transporter [Neisseria montereyensis]